MDTAPLDLTRAAAPLDALTRQVRADLARIAHPRQSWLVPKIGPDGAVALDVIVVGAGQSGLATAFGLKRAKVDNILVVDAASRGQEGPWRTYARMPTLRSPKDFTGPDLDVPSLTYQSWHEARYGAADWQALKLIRRGDWADYLDWMRDTVGLPVKNETRVTAITPDLVTGLLAVEMIGPGGQQRRYARKIVLATGQDGMGAWWLPEILRELPIERRAHSADAIDFVALAGKRVVVIGAGASAFDNAAMALEAGAAEVTLLCRRAEPQVVQPYRWLTFKGFLAHLGDLDDAWRWRFMRHILGMREGFPQDTFDRCARHAAFRLVSGAPIERAETTGDGVRLTTPVGLFDADFVIGGTGIDMDFRLRPELAACADQIAIWADRYAPPTEERNDRLARFPYLDRDYAFSERTPGAAPWLRNVHLFSIASTMSFGPSGSSINAMTTAVPRLVSGITRGLFEADIERHWASLQAYGVPQAVIPPRS